MEMLALCALCSRAERADAGLRKSINNTGAKHLGPSARPGCSSTGFNGHYFTEPVVSLDNRSRVQR